MEECKQSRQLMKGKKKRLFKKETLKKPDGDLKTLLAEYKRDKVEKNLIECRNNNYVFM